MKYLFLFSLIFSIDLIQCSQEVPCDIEFQSFTEQQGSTTITRKLYAIHTVKLFLRTIVWGSMIEKHSHQGEHGCTFVQTEDYLDKGILFALDRLEHTYAPSEHYFCTYKNQDLDQETSLISKRDVVKKIGIKPDFNLNLINIKSCFKIWEKECINSINMRMRAQLQSQHLPANNNITQIKKQSGCCQIS